MNNKKNKLRLCGCLLLMTFSVCRAEAMRLCSCFSGWNFNTQSLAAKELVRLVKDGSNDKSPLCLLGNSMPGNDQLMIGCVRDGTTEIEMSVR